MRTNLLETQFEHVVVSSQEFNTSVLELINKLNKSPEYVRLFQEAFPQFIHNPINPYTLNASLACYVMSLRSFNSPFDQYARGETNEISAEVKTGFNVFMGKALCGTCHFAPSFGGIVPPFYSEQESEILGVPEKSAAPWKLDGDIGRKGGMPKDNSVIYEYSFKTVTVRNVALTGPYFHNGAYNTLEEVIDFYHKGGGAGIGLEVPYQTLPFDSLSLTKAEQLAIKKFMEALTDTVNLTSVPTVLPSFPTNLALNKRIIGGVY
jgi:cytochrome c peroxidase